MYGLAEYQVLRQAKEESPHGVAVEGPAKATDEYREPMPYVVRDLSWELAQYLGAAGMQTDL